MKINETSFSPQKAIVWAVWRKKI